MLRATIAASALLVLPILLGADAGGAACPMLEPSWTPRGSAGDRRLGLVIGVGDYATLIEGREIDLSGPPGDAATVHAVLTSSYGFAPHNVCLLIDTAATHDRVDAAFARITDVAAAGDSVVVYFAGHGAQARDWDGPEDEADGLDETWMLHDSRVDGRPDLIDDELNRKLAALHAATSAVTVVVDACNAGTAIRDVDPSNAARTPVARQSAVLEVPRPRSGAGGFRPAELPGLVYLSAAKDGTSALERGGEGLFTKALVAALSEGPATYSELSHRLQRHLASLETPQVAQFQGDLTRRVFGADRIERPLSWVVSEVEAGAVVVGGPAFPGWTPGAELALFPADTSPEEAATATPRALATLDDGATPFRGRATLRSGEAAPGDLAVLRKPGRLHRLRVAFATGGGEPSALPQAKTGDLVLQFARSGFTCTGAKADAQSCPPERAAYQWVDGGERPDFVLGADGDDVVIYAADGTLRNRVGPGDDGGTQAYRVAQNIGMHARRRSLLALQGPGAQAGILELTVLPDERVAARTCPRRAVPPPDPTSRVQEVPLCGAYKARIRRTGGAPTSYPDGIYVVLLALLNDGSVQVLPRDGSEILLSRDGQTMDVPVLYGKPPLGAPDHLLAVGTSTKVDWTGVEQEAVRGGGFLFDHDLPAAMGAWTTEQATVQVTADPTLWSPGEMEDPDVCRPAIEATRGGRPCP